MRTLVFTLSLIITLILSATTLHAVPKSVYAVNEVAAVSAVKAPAEKLSKKELRKAAKAEKKQKKIQKKLAKIKAWLADDDGKTAAIVAYLTLIGFLVSLLALHEKGNELSAFHLRQVLGIAVTGLALGIVAIIPVLGWIVAVVGGLLLLISWIIGLVSAINGSTKPVFFLGKQYQKWFAGIE